ncbi:MAG: alpha/beta hydrolase [Erysipelotrichia bacterium]|nr:alpha/beta hydrolase [Erysipelotrichia bacterium]NCC53929.1 alpha/beta hydrolase [Erysipelotrichia bacterium]
MDLEQLNIKVEGTGQAMLLLHGWGVDHHMMEEIFEHFKPTYQVCTLDLPGFGKSANPPYAFSIYDYVNVIKEVILKYALQKPIIIAHSFGARIAFHYAAMFPVKYLIITGGAGIRATHDFDYYFKVYLFKILRFLHIENELGSYDYKQANDVMKATLVKIVNDDARADIEKIPCEMLLVWGEKDMQTPLWMAEQICQLNAKATLIIFKEDDHFAYYHQMHRFIKVCESVLEGGV